MLLFFGRAGADGADGKAGCRKPGQWDRDTKGDAEGGPLQSFDGPRGARLAVRLVRARVRTRVHVRAPSVHQ